MEERLISIEKELGCDELNTPTPLFFEIIVRNGKDHKSIGSIKMQFHVDEYQLFRTEQQTCLFCDETCKSSKDAKTHMLIHTQTPFICDIFDFQFFLKWNIKLDESVQEKMVSSYEISDKVEVVEVPLKEEAANSPISDHAVSPQNMSSASQTSMFCEATSSIFIQDLKTENNPSDDSDSWLQKMNSVAVTHKEQEELNCSICGYKAKSVTAFRTHLHLHKKFSCDVCDFKSIRPSALKKHKLIHDVKLELQVIENDKSNVCPLCGYVAVTKSNFDIHFRSHTGEQPYACTLCDFRTSRKSSLGNHMFLIHNEKKSYVCETCKIDFKNGKEYASHLKTHKIEPRFQCDICGLRLVSKASLKNHNRTHTGEKPFKCDVCDYRSNCRSGLNVHKYIHVGVKSFLCDKCDYKSFRLGRLKSHMRTHTGDRTEQCTMCQYKCYDKTKLRKHMRTHTGEKPFACEFCEYKSSASGNLHTHVRGVHRTHARVQCANCSFKCYLKSNLEEHMKIHSSSVVDEAQKHEIVSSALTVTESLPNIQV